MDRRMDIIQVGRGDRWCGRESRLTKEGFAIFYRENKCRTEKGRQKMVVRMDIN